MITHSHFASDFDVAIADYASATDYDLAAEGAGSRFGALLEQTRMSNRRSSEPSRGAADGPQELQNARWA